MYEYLILTLMILVVWFLIYVIKKEERREIMLMSLYTAPFGLTEFIFVPAYWNPHTLFNFASRFGFDIESIFYCFAIGGIGSVIYESFFKVKHYKFSINKRDSKFHLLTLLSAPVIFLFLYFNTTINQIYSASIAMFFGAIAALWCRPDLSKKVFIGGTLFSLFYFIIFYIITLIFPDFVAHSWNFQSLSNVLIAGIPVEELMFSFTFGMLWSSYYERIKGYKLIRQ
ncbi:hypothetical protein HYT58_02830 [Candidatus Woesearchaeota archaeon]|nr:hypothetical protein [Candidatus Woesearchaeota archaeon]